MAHKEAASFLEAVLFARLALVNFDRFFKGLDVFLAFRNWVVSKACVGQANLCLGSGRANRLRHRSVREKNVVRHVQDFRLLKLQARGHPADVAAKDARHLVNGKEVLHAVRELPYDKVCVLRGPVTDVAVSPAALALKFQRQIPVVKGKPRRDVFCQKLVDEAVVKVQALLVGRSVDCVSAAVGAVAHDARPRDAKAVVGNL